MPDHDVTVRVVLRRNRRGTDVPDVAEGEWFYGYVEYVYENGLMDGVSDTTFEPDGNMTRAMVWAILARIERRDGVRRELGRDGSGVGDGERRERRARMPTAM